MAFYWGVKVDGDLLDYRAGNPCPWSRLTDRIKKKMPVMMNILWTDGPASGFTHAMIVCRAREVGRKKTVTIWNPGRPAGRLYRDVAYSWACRLETDNTAFGWKWQGSAGFSRVRRVVR